MAVGGVSCFEDFASSESEREGWVQHALTIYITCFRSTNDVFFIISLITKESKIGFLNAKSLPFSPSSYRKSFYKYSTPIYSITSLFQLNVFSWYCLSSKFIAMEVKGLMISGTGFVFLFAFDVYMIVFGVTVTT